MKARNEVLLVGIASIPAIYLMIVWSQVPDTVPTHWGIGGKADAWGPKATLWLLPGLSIFLYMLVYSLSKIDPKNRLEEMGNKLFQFRLIIALFISALFTAILHASANTQVQIGSVITFILGLMFVGLGNYFQSLRPNYFMGIRTPWTLENEEVWRKTHRLGGRIWVIGGLLLVALSFILPVNMLFICMITVVLAICFVPIVYSYLAYKKERIAG